MISNSFYRPDSHMKTVMNVEICENTKLCRQNMILASKRNISNNLRKVN